MQKLAKKQNAPILRIKSHFYFKVKAPGPVATNQAHIWDSGSVRLGDHALKFPQKLPILLHPIKHGLIPDLPEGIGSLNPSGASLDFLQILIGELGRFVALAYN